MRNPSLAILALVALLGSGCGRLVNIRVSDVVETTVERGTIIEELTGSLGFDGLTAIDVFDAQELQNQGDLLPPRVTQHRDHERAQDVQ